MVGAAYLVWLGVGLIVPWLRGRASGGLDLSQARAIVVRPASFWSLYRRGFALQASNPKNIAFFVAILPQFVDPAGNVGLQMLILGLISVLLELPILLLYGLAFSRLAQLVTDRLVTRIEAGAGGILVALGGALALSERR